jgi:hypothetical protein
MSCCLHCYGKHVVGHSLYCVVIDIMKFRVFWHVALCSDVEMDWRFRGAYCLHHQGDDGGGGQYAPLKHRSTSTWLHDATSQVPKLSWSISHPGTRVKRCTYGRSIATLLNPDSVTKFSHKHSLTVARYTTVVVAVPSTVHFPVNYKMKIYYLRWHLKI